MEFCVNDEILCSIKIKSNSMKKLASDFLHMRIWPFVMRIIISLSAWTFTK